MKKSTHKKSQEKLKVVLLALLILALLGVVAYALTQNYSGIPSTQPNTVTEQQPVVSEDDAKREADIVLRKVKMNMTKDEVIAAVGQPHSCSTKSTKERDTTYIMEQCSYGQKDAPGHALITFLNGKVWGTTYESGKIHTD